MDKPETQSAVGSTRLLGDGQTCKTCRWAQWQRTPRGTILKRVAGICTYHVEWPNIPTCQRMPMADKHGIWPKDGATCKCYERESSNAAGERPGQEARELKP